jgi:lipopolysaccharide transport system permease protein
MNFMSTSVSNPSTGQPAAEPLGSLATAGPAVVAETVIEPRKGWIGIDWGELARARELLFFLVWRDIKVRYKQATLGVLWAVLVPLIQVAIFSVIFGSGLNLASQLSGPAKTAFPMFIFSGMLGWQVIARSLSEGGMSLVSQQHLLTKIYFPRMFVPTAAVGGALFDLMISLVVYVPAMVYFKVVPSWTLVFFPLLVLQTAVLGAGLAYLLSALTVTYRDFRFIIPFLAQIWMWTSFIMLPVPYSFTARTSWQIFFHLNPVYGIVSTFRAVLMDSYHGWTPSYLISSIAITLAIFVLGLFYFRKTERRFADIA